jgi:hypothetical protein
MKALAIASSLVFALAATAAAQTADKKATPGDAPTKSMDAATPEMKGPGKGEHPPTGRMDEAVPPMKAGETSSGTAGTKMSQADCTALWKQANPNNAPTITMTEAQPYVADFKAADPDNDGTLDQNEFLQACDKGGVSKGAAKQP